MIRVTINNTDHEPQVVVVNPDRFLPSRQLIRQQLDAGKLGEVGLIRIHRWEPNVLHDDDGDLPAGLLRDIDLVLWLVGKLPDAIHTVEQSDTSGRFVQVHLGFPGGAMALIDYANRLPDGDGYQSLSVIGSAGAAYSDDYQNMQLVFRGGNAQAVRAEETGRRHAAAVQEQIESLQAGHDVAASVAEWQDVLKVAGSVRRAISSGEPGGVSPRTVTKPSVVRGLTPSGSPTMPFRCAALSAVKHDYVARGVATHPRFEMVVVADDPQIPGWAHERNQQLADSFKIPYVRDVERALREFKVDVAIVSPEAERHCDLSIRAAAFGVHVIQDKPLTTQPSAADRLVEAIEKSGVKFLMWNQNCPANDSAGRLKMLFVNGLR